LEDIHIIELFFQRTEDAITEIQKKYGKLCQDVARRILPDQRDVEECINDAYFRVWASIPPKRPPSLEAYLARITRNLALDKYAYNTAAQRNTALTEAFEELEAYLSLEDPAGEMTAEWEFHDFLNRFLRLQSKEARRFFLRRYWYGENIREIAQSCHVSEAKVKSSLFHTRTRLRDALEKVRNYI